jgi:hypothetical protein
MTLGLSRPEREVLMEASLVGLWHHQRGIHGWEAAPVVALLAAGVLLTGLLAYWVAPAELHAVVQGKTGGA